MRATLLLIVAVQCWSATSELISAADRPNILWISIEDSSQDLGCYGDKYAVSPNIDKLASQGCRYTNCFTHAGVCAPSRSGIITGMYPCSIGTHFMRCKGVPPAHVKCFTEHLRAAGYYCTNNNKTDYNAPIDLAATWDANSRTAHWRDRPEGAPFLAIFNTDLTHESRIFNAALGEVTPDQVRVPPYLPDDPAILYDRAAYYELIRRMDEFVGARVRELEEAGLAEDTIVIYYSDNGGVLPRSKRYCYEDGLHTAMIVRIPEKWRHLAPSGPGTVVEDPVSFIDLPPTILSLAGVPVPEYMHGTPFLGPDRKARQYAFGGRNRMDERYDLVRTVTDGRFRYIRNYAPHRPWGQHVAYAWQQKGYRAWEQAHIDGRLDATQDRFWREKPTEELYDLDADPDELTNLAYDAKFKATAERLRRALSAELKRTGCGFADRLPRVADSPGTE